MDSHAAFVAAVCSLVLPGWGQLRNGERAKGFVVLCMTGSVLLGMGLATFGPAAMRSPLTVAFLAVTYLFVLGPAAIDAYQVAAGRPRPLLSGQSRWYVLFMLATIGPAAIPLLWHSPRFSRGAKLLLTVSVALVAAGLILLTVLLGPLLSRWMDQAGANDPLLRELLDVYRPGP